MGTVVDGSSEVVMLKEIKVGGEGRSGLVPVGSDQLHEGSSHA